MQTINSTHEEYPAIEKTVVKVRKLTGRALVWKKELVYRQTANGPVISTKLTDANIEELLRFRESENLIKLYNDSGKLMDNVLYSKGLRKIAKD